MSRHLLPYSAQQSLDFLAIEAARGVRRNPDSREAVETVHQIGGIYEQLGERARREVIAAAREDIADGIHADDWVIVLDIAGENLVALAARESGMKNAGRRFF